MDLLRALNIDGGRVYLALSGVPSYARLADKGYVTGTSLQNGNVHVVLTDMGRRALASFIN